MRLCDRSGRITVIILFLLILLIALPGSALGAGEEADPFPLHVTTGVFVTSLYDLSLKDKSFNAVFWAWFVFPRDVPVYYYPQESVEVMGTKSFTRLQQFDDPPKSLRWVSVEYHAVVIDTWEMDDFPFDRQVLTIKLDETRFDADKIVFVPDTKNSKIDSRVSIPGWEIDGFSIQSGRDTDETTYGDPTLSGRSTYANTVITIALKRHGIRLLFNLLTAAYIAFILGILVLFLHPKFVDARKVIITSAMITIIGNHYIISATLPEMHTFTLIDRVMITTFITISLIAFISVVTAHYVRVKKIANAVTINNISRWAILSVYVVLNVIFFVGALT